MSSRSEGFLTQSLEAAILEQKALREKIQSLTRRLGDAETELRFYGNPKNYAVTRGLENSPVIQDRLIGDFSFADNTTDTTIAGARARKYFKKYENETLSNH